MQQENPTWDAPFEFAISDPSATLEIYVWSKGLGFLERDRFLGRVVSVGRIDGYCCHQWLNRWLSLSALVE